MSAAHLAAAPAEPLLAAFTAACGRFAPRLALVGRGRALTYARLLSEARSAARCLGEATGGRPARLGLCLENSPGHVSAYFGVLLGGHLPFLLDPSLHPAELMAIAEECSLSGLIVDEPRRRGLAAEARGPARELPGGGTLLRLAPPGPARLAARSETRVCRFTSGSMGRPKCLEFSGGAVLAAARGWVEGSGLGRRSPERVLCLASLANGLAFNTSLLASFMVGAELHFLAGVPMSREVARRIREGGITRLVAFPTLYRLLADGQGPEGGPLAGLRSAVSAGAPLWPEVRSAFRERFGLDISDYYGIAETGPCTFEPDPAHGRGLGLPLPGVELRIAGEGEVGEVLVRAPSMASAYLNAPGRLEARLDGKGFYRSGDLGRLVEGRLYLEGRIRQQINVGGRKVDPAEVARVALGVKGVRDALAFEDRSGRWEAGLHLAVVAPEVSRAALVAACRSRLASYKVPGRVSFVPEIPRNGVGKARLPALQHLLAERSGRAVNQEQSKES